MQHTAGVLFHFALKRIIVDIISLVHRGEMLGLKEIQSITSNNLKLYINLIIRNKLLHYCSKQYSAINKFRSKHRHGNHI